MVQGSGKRLSASQLEEIKNRYLSMESSEDIAKSMGRSGVGIRKALDRLGVTRRDISLCHRKYAVDEGAFDSLTPESRYWVGMLMSDGNVGKNNNAVSLCLSSVDAETVHRFKAFLRSEHPVSEWSRDGKNYTEITICSKRMKKSLVKLGVVPKKSLISKVIGLEMDVDFWRGAMDGDGQLSIYGNCPYMQFVGSDSICKQFLDFCEAALPAYSPKFGYAGDIWHCRFHGYGAYNMIKILYEGHTCVMERKKLMANKILNDYRDKSFRILGRARDRSSVG